MENHSPNPHKSSWVILFLLFSLGSNVSFAQNSLDKNRQAFKNEINAGDINTQLANSKELLFPESTRRFYAQNGNGLIWFSNTADGQLMNAIFLLESFINYGLNAYSYHPDDLNMLAISKLEEKGSKEMIRADILLTDAMIAFINDLHYGKANPILTRSTIDRHDFQGLKADSILAIAINRLQFIQIIEKTQPDIKDYRDLQEFISAVVEQVDASSIAEDVQTIKMAAINLERWRWATPLNKKYVLINIPAAQLRFSQDSTFEVFKTIVGKASTPTPELYGDIDWFITNPEKRFKRSFSSTEVQIPAEYLNKIIPGNNMFVLSTKSISDYILNRPDNNDTDLGNVLFSFSKNSKFYLYGSSDAKTFNAQEKATSNGSIIIEQIEDFAEQLLKSDSVMQNKLIRFHRSLSRHKPVQFNLKEHIPTYIRYFTCGIGDGEFIEYQDIYKKDKALAEQIFNFNEHVRDNVQKMKEAKSKASFSTMSSAQSK